MMRRLPSSYSSSAGLCFILTVFVIGSCHFTCSDLGLIQIPALQYIKVEHILIELDIWKYVFFKFAKIDITFCWVPSHVGIKGNEKANAAAKSALELPQVKAGVPHINLYIFFPLGKMIGMVQLQTNFILSNRFGKLAVLLQAMQEGRNCHAH